MRIIYLKKHIELDELPFIDATDVFKYASENTKEGLSLYQFALIIEKYFNYWNTNSPTAFGNPDYNHLEGEFIGYIKAKESVNFVSILGLREDRENASVYIKKVLVVKQALLDTQKSVAQKEILKTLL